MAADNLFNLPLEIQTAVAAGYLASAIARAGLYQRSTAVEIAFSTFAFGVPALLVVRAMSDRPEWIAVLAAGAAALAVGSAWRMFLRRWVVWAMNNARIHMQDGLPNAWVALTQDKPIKVSQVSVHMKDGRVLYQNQHAYVGAPLDGLYFGSDGSIVMTVEEEEFPDGKTEVRQGIQVDGHGTRVTYIPASEIQRVNIRGS